MFKINHIQNSNSNHIEITDIDRKTYAKISLDDGGSLQILKFANTNVITDLKPFNYKQTYASAILFPFVNRINNGMYTFNGKQYFLEINDKEYNHAIHGMVYNKSFKIISKHSYKNKALVKLRYEEKNKLQGFPFKFNIDLTYLLTNEALSFKVDVKNKDNVEFPFSIGWHPYFYTSNIYTSSISFDCANKILLNEKMLPNGSKEINKNFKLKIKEDAYDDCFKLIENKIKLHSPEYSLTIKGSTKPSFLQIYTPKKRNSIAIEPTSASADCFNNEIGLQILKPEEVYNVEWDINFIKN